MTESNDLKVNKTFVFLLKPISQPLEFSAQTNGLTFPNLFGDSLGFQHIRERSCLHGNLATGQEDYVYVLGLLGAFTKILGEFFCSITYTLKMYTIFPNLSRACAGTLKKGVTELNNEDPEPPLL